MIQLDVLRNLLLSTSSLVHNSPGFSLISTLLVFSWLKTSSKASCRALIMVSGSTDSGASERRYISQMYVSYRQSILITFHWLLLEIFSSWKSSWIWPYCPPWNPKWWGMRCSGDEKYQKYQKRQKRHVLINNVPILLTDSQMRNLLL